ncbi:hypothetical protein N9917_01460 [Deltaproteobacteria bacterium]|nr:hypothetical protein [Deltaproteobacteria bacterium]
MKPAPWNDPNQPDVEYTCVTHEGRTWFVVQATGPVLSAALLAWEYKTIGVRFIFDPETMLSNVEAGKPAGDNPSKFILFANGDMQAPILSCDPDPLLDPLRRTLTNKEGWVLVIQVMLGEPGQRYAKLISVAPDGSASVVRGSDGQDTVPRWLVGMVD